MNPATAKVKVLQEIELIPEDRLAEIYSLLHYFRLGLEVSKDTRSVMEFAGCWQDMPGEEFDSFVHEIAERRRRAFLGRRSDESSAG